jgi:poly(beta-D-mannuronate) lyase
MVTKHRVTRRWLPGAALMIAFAGPAAAIWPGPAAAVTPHAVTVSSLAALQSALGTAQPGDRIQVADGTYTATRPIQITRSGTTAAPITVAAAHVGGATIKGSAGFSFGTVSNVVVSGFQLTGSSGVTVPTGASHVHISRNVFQLAGSVQSWLVVAGDDVEVDHNTFQHKSTVGVFVQVIGPGSAGMAQRTWLHHNYFFDHSFGGANGGESIRLGLSGRQHSPAHAIIEYNLFEKANGDLEAISVKSSDDTVRYNTIRNSRGTISLRHGWRSTVDGNFILGGSSGIRFFGNDHLIMNNVVENSTGQALEVGGGEVRDDTTSGTDHEAADRCVVVFNTFVNDTSSPIRVGDGGKAFQPDTVTIADNIVSGTGSAARVVGGTHLTWQGNILSGVSAGGVPGGGYTSMNPKLVLDPSGLYRLSAGSPAIGAATGSYPQVIQDMDGQPRAGAKDVGADQYSAGGVLHEPLTTANVGPSAP